MEMYQLKYLVETVRTGSIVKAAEKLFVSQPAVSQALARLEKELNVQIYIRKEKHFTLTDAGKLVYVYAERIMYDLDSFYNEFQKDHSKKVFNIISPDDGFRTFLLPLYLVKHPEVTVTNQIADTSMIQRMIEGSNVDIAISTQDMTSTRLQSVRMMDLDLFVLVPRNSPLSKKDKLTMQDLKGQPFVRYQSDSIYIKAYKQQIDSIFGDSLFNHFNVVYEGNETSWNLMQMEQGFFFFVTSYRLLKSDIYPHHKVIPLDDKKFSETMYATFKKTPAGSGAEELVSDIRNILSAITKKNYYCKNGLMKIYN